MAASPSQPLPPENAAVTTQITLLQGIINRLATNSSSCKTWCLTLVSALFSFAGATRTPAIAGFALVPVVIFGFVDTMYLAQERAYRDLYEEIVTEIRDSKYTVARAFSANAARTSTHVKDAFASWSIWPVYGVLILVIIGYGVAAYCGVLPVFTAAPK
jgi:hypothetical protein